MVSPLFFITICEPMGAILFLGPFNTPLVGYWDRYFPINFFLNQARMGSSYHFRQA